MMDELTRIDLNLFVVFDRIYAERNLTRAAEHLALSQPAVSNALNRLRKTLGDPLFEKSAGGMRPTAYAESIKEDVSEALRLLTVSAQAKSRFDMESSSRVFRMSVIELLDAPVMSMLGDIAPRARNLSFRCFRVDRRELVGALSAGEIDLAVDIELPASSNLIRTPYAASLHVCAMRSGHPLSRGDLSLEDYLAYPHVHVSGRRKGAGAVDIALRRHGRRRRIIAALQSYVSAPRLVRDSDCLITVPRDWAESEGLDWKPLPLDVPPLETFLYRHRRTDGDEAVLWLEKVIADRRMTGAVRDAGAELTPPIPTPAPPRR